MKEDEMMRENHFQVLKEWLKSKKIELKLA